MSFSVWFQTYHILYLGKHMQTNSIECCICNDNTTYVVELKCNLHVFEYILYNFQCFIHNEHYYMIFNMLNREYLILCLISITFITWYLIFIIWYEISSIWHIHMYAHVYIVIYIYIHHVYVYNIYIYTLYIPVNGIW